MSKSILMLEHDDDERYIVRAVFEENNYDIRFDFVSNSDEVFAHLLNCKRTGSRYPSLILLDYVVFPFNAVDIIRQLKSEKEFTPIPVVVLCGTVEADIIRECYAAGASSFIQKPSLTKEAEMKVRNFVQYWFETVELP